MLFLPALADPPTPGVPQDADHYRTLSDLIPGDASACIDMQNESL